MDLLHKFFESGRGTVALNAQEFAVLDAYRSVGPGPACAADIYMYLRKKLKRDPRLPTIYKIVTRLRALGLLEDAGEISPPEGGRPRRIFRLTRAGRDALDLGDRMLSHSTTSELRMA